MKSKYIDEKFRSYFIFGESPSQNTADLNDGVEDICSVTKDEAEKLISDRTQVMRLIHLFNEKYPNEFQECFNAFLQEYDNEK